MEIVICSGKRLVKAGTIEAPCSCGGTKAVYRTETPQPSMWYDGCYHLYYGVYCPSCKNGSITRFPDKGELFEMFEKRLIERCDDE